MTLTYVPANPTTQKNSANVVLKDFKRNKLKKYPNNDYKIRKQQDMIVKEPALSRGYGGWKLYEGSEEIKEI